MSKEKKLKLKLKEKKVSSLASISSHSLVSDNSQKTTTKHEINKKEAQDWYDYIDINHLLIETSNNKHDYKVIGASSQDDLHLSQKVSKAFLKLKSSQLKAVVIPINLGDDNQGIWQGIHWVGLVIRYDQETKELKAFYNDSFGISMSASLPNLKQILINHGLNENEVIDLKKQQQSNGYDCGPYTVSNLDSLARNGALMEITAEQILTQRQRLAEIKLTLPQEVQEILDIPDVDVDVSDIKSVKKDKPKKKEPMASTTLNNKGYDNSGDEDNSPFMRQLDNYYSGIVTKLHNLNKEEFTEQGVLSRKLRNLDKNICYNMHGSILGGVIEGKVLFKSYNNYSYLVI